MTLEADKAALSVADDRGRVVWSSDPGQAFVGASVGDVSWTEKFGYFWARVSRSNRLVDQTITSVSESAGTVQVKGEVAATTRAPLHADPVAGGEVPDRDRAGNGPEPGRDVRREGAHQRAHHIGARQG